MEKITLHSSLAHLQGTQAAAIDRLAPLFRPIGLQRGQLLAGPGQNGRSLYLLGSGILHHYRLHHGIPRTIQLYLPGSFLGSPAMPLPPSELDYTTALTPATVLAAGQTALHAHCQHHPSDIQLLLAIQQTICLAQLQLIEMLHLQPSASRKKLMCQQLGPHLYHIPRAVLASYLCMSRKHLGRLSASELRGKG